MSRLCCNCTIHNPLLRSNISEDFIRTLTEDRKNPAPALDRRSIPRSQDTKRESIVVTNHVVPTGRPGNPYSKVPSVAINTSEKRPIAGAQNHPPTYSELSLHPMVSQFDPNMIKIRFPRHHHERVIHCPPQSIVGTNRQRWYVVFVGREVGIFNEW